MSKGKVLIVEGESINNLDICAKLEKWGYMALNINYNQLNSPDLKFMPDIILTDLCHLERLENSEFMELNKKWNIPLLYFKSPDINTEIRDIDEDIIIRPFNEENLKFILENSLQKLPLKNEIVITEEKFLHLVEIANEGILTLDEDFNIIFVNKKMADMIGYSVNEMLNHPFNEFMFEEEFNDHITRKNCRIEGNSEQYERKFKHKDGHPVWTIVSAAPLIDEDSNFYGSLTIITDVTPQKKAEEKIKNQSLKLERKLNKLNCLYSLSEILSHPDNSLDEIYKAIVRLVPNSMSYPEIACIKVLVEGFKIQSPNFKETPWKLTVDISYLKETFGTITICYLKEKRDKYKGPFSIQEVNLVQTICNALARFVKHKKVDNALKESEEMYRNMIDTAQSGIWSLDRNGKTTFVNQRMAEMLGYQVNEMISKPYTDFIDHEDKSRMENHAQRKKDGKKEVYEFKLKRKDNSHLWALISSTDISDSNGNYIGLVRIVTDISARKGIEEQLYERELESRAIFNNIAEAINLMLMKEHSQQKIYQKYN
ncbi:MAG: PAS domain S-box protein [Methanomicrobiales archaeon]